MSIIKFDNYINTKQYVHVSRLKLLKKERERESEIRIGTGEKSVCM